MNEEGKKRVRAVKAVVIDGKSVAEVSKDEDVKLPKLYDWIRKFNEYGQLRGLPKGGDKRSKDLTPYEDPIREFMNQNEGAKHEHIVEHIKEKYDFDYPKTKAKEIRKLIISEQQQNETDKECGETTGSIVDGGISISDLPKEFNSLGLPEEVLEPLLGEFAKFHKVFKEAFGGLKDHRSRSQHKQTDMLLVQTMAAAAGIDTTEGAHRFAKVQWNKLRPLLGIKMEAPPDPSTSTRQIREIDKDEATDALHQFIQVQRKNMGKPTKGIKIAVDGKTLKHSDDGENHPQVVVVSAVTHGDYDTVALTKGGKLAAERNAALSMIKDGLIPVEDNEISFDALYCNPKICREVKDRGGDYMVGLKNNQKLLLKSAELYMATHEPTYERINPDELNPKITREVCVWHLDEEYKKMLDWTGLESICTYKVIRDDDADKKKKNKGMENKPYIRILLSSKKATAEEVEETVRGHWGIEILHYILDVTLDEDYHQACKGSAPIIHTILRRIGTHLVRSNKERGSMKGEMDLAKLDFLYLLALMTQFKDKYPEWSHHFQSHKSGALTGILFLVIQKS